jgi:hypothetical protein
LSNTLRVWITPKAFWKSGIRPLVEASVPRDRWTNIEGAEVVSYPLIPNDLAENSANLLFSGDLQGVRSADPEIPGGFIALVATNDNEMQKPPHSLERIHASVEKQISFSRWVLKGEDEISGINSSLSDFLLGVDATQPLYVWVNVGERVPWTQPTCGNFGLRRTGR